MLRNSPPPVLVMEHEPDLSAAELYDLVTAAVRERFPHLCDALYSSGCRCVSIDRLALILRSGIDVDPPTGTIWVNWLSKALEYGESNKVLMAYDPDLLAQTFREVPTDSDPADLAVLATTYPTRLTSVDQSRHWYSRLPPDDRRLASPYEAEYARWIPGNPADALRAIIAIGPIGTNLIRTVQQQLPP